MSKKKPKPATAGEKIVAGVRFCKPLIDGLTFDDRDDLIRYIDRAIARAVRKERERCRAAVLAHARKLRTNLSGCRDEKAADHWRQCIESFEEMIES